MASPGNQHCANCIGTLSFPIGVQVRNKVVEIYNSEAEKESIFFCVHLFWYLTETGEFFRIH